MCQHVIFNGPRLVEATTADSTLEQSLVEMDLHMRVQTARGQGLSAYVASVQLLVRMAVDVSAQLRRVHKLFAAHVTTVRARVRVGLSVTLHSVLRHERLAASVAIKRTLAAMQSHVRLQQTRLTETLPAHGARVRVRVGVVAELVCAQ